MKKIILIPAVILACVIVVCTIFGVAWCNAEEKLESKDNFIQRLLDDNEELQAALKKELVQSSIIGLVYADSNSDKILDWSDNKINDDLGNLKIVLYVYKKTDKGTESVKIATTTIQNGEYCFEKVAPGEYFVGIEYRDTSLFYRRYTQINHIGSGTLTVEQGTTVIGPIIFLSHTAERG